MDYRHGTGHGVGSFLNVHEGPQGIGMRPEYNTDAAKMRPGMTVSNEPGFYKDGHFGIRIESVVLTKKAQTKHNFGETGYLGFERVTMAPIQIKLIDTSLLLPHEVQWMNDYHSEVKAKLEPLLQNDQRALKWLQRECEHISV